MLDPILVSPRYKPVGITKGPGENAHEYTFVSRDDEQVLKNGEYVYYELTDPGNVGVPLAGTRPPGVIESVNVAGTRTTGLTEPENVTGIQTSRRVLGRIIKRLPLQLYPDTFLAEPEISPAQVAAMVGYDSHANELFELHVAIMGYYEQATGSFINPWIPPQSGKQIFLADDEMLATILSRKRAGQNGSATIGSLLTRAPEAVPVVLSVKDLVSTHLAIIASTGAGKSYLASVIIEELMQPYNKACVLILDPHGEYGTLTEIPNAAQFSEDGHGRGSGYRAQVRDYTPDEVKVRISSLNMGDMRHLLSEMTEKQQYLLNRALRKVNETKRGTPWGSEDLKTAIKSVAKQKGEEDSEGADDSSTVHAIMWRIEDRFEHSYTFDDLQHLDLPEIFKPRQCTLRQSKHI